MSNKGYHWRTTTNHKGSVGKHWNLSDETRKKQSMAKKGKKFTEEARKRMSLSHKGKKKLYPISEETRKKLSLALKKFYDNGGIIPSGRLGKKATPETRKKLSISHIGKFKGNLSPNWRGGITPINYKIRNSLEYKLWREAVFKRDDYTCVWCGDNIGGNLEADHIKPFSLFLELRFAIDNGRTLCKDCHKTTETFGNKRS